MWICEFHFKNSDYYVTVSGITNKKILYPTAVPSVFLNMGTVLFNIKIVDFKVINFQIDYIIF